MKGQFRNSAKCAEANRSKFTTKNIFDHFAKRRFSIVCSGVASSQQQTLRY